jgi:hypothetical protein
MDDQQQSQSPIRGQALRCAHCGAFFTFVGGRIERLTSGKLAVRHFDCGALNEIASNSRDAEGRELWTVVGDVPSVQRER